MNILELLKEPWPWYVAGPLIGLMVPALLILDNKQFGISSTMRDFCAAILPKRFDYFNYSLKNELWRNILVIGVLLGGLFSALFLMNDNAIAISEKTVLALQQKGISDFSGYVPLEIFSWNALFSLKGIVFILLGGFLVGFGTRYADGCTSGHAIMGMSLFSTSSMVAVIGFFIGGLISTHFLIQLILRLP